MRSRRMFMNASFFVDSVLFTIVKENYRLIKRVNLLLIQHSNINTMLLKTIRNYLEFLHSGHL